MADSELSWSTQTDWDAASEREQVVTRNVGSRDRHTLQLGFDPEYGVVSQAVNYWPLDEASGSTTFEDVIGAGEGTLEKDDGSMNYREQGPLGTFSIDGNGDSISLGELETLKHPGSFTIFAWWERYDDEDFDMVFTSKAGSDDSGVARFELRQNQKVHGYYNDPDDETVKARTTSLELNKPFPMIVRFVESDENELFIHSPAETWKHPDYEEPLPDRDEQEWSENGARLLDLTSSGSRSRSKNVSDIIYWDYAISTSDVDELFSTFQSGRLVTDWREDDFRAEELTINTEIPSATGVSVTVEQDTDGNGDANREQSFDLEGGEETFVLDTFKQSDLGGYRLNFDLSTGSQYKTPKVNFGTIGLNAVSNSVWDAATGPVETTDGVFDTTV